MELVYTFDYVKLGKKDFNIISSRQYINGFYVGEQDPQDKLILVSYLSLFPGRDILRVKLGKSYSTNNLYTIIYFDKRFKNEGFIGIFSFAEYNTVEPFFWGKEEELMKEVFGKFKETFPGLFSEENANNDLDALLSYYNWMDKKVKEFYLAWLDAKSEYYGFQTKKLRDVLAETFSSISGEENTEEIKEIKVGVPQKKIKLSIDDLKQRSSSIQLDDIERDNRLERMLKFEKVNQIDKKILDKYDRIWEIQMINSYGNIMTNIIRFKNGQYIESDFDEFEIQGLEAMSYSVLKTLVDEKKLNLQQIKANIPGRGIEYIYFQYVQIEDSDLLVIMNVKNINKETKQLEEVILGGERETLEKISYELSEHPEWFENNRYKIRNGKTEVENLIYRNCRAYFKELEKMNA
ncbi:MAG: hypothetical protein ACTSU2_14295 [Promethearchaeota archaeon]